MSQFVEELKRRKVIRVGVAYLVAAWVLLQVTDIVVPILELPGWTARVILYALSVGFLITLVLTWLYELTRSGVKRDRGIQDASANATTTGQKIEHGVVAVLAIALLGIAFFWFLGKDDRWARNTALPQLEEYVAEGNWEAAYRLAKTVEERVPGDAAMAELWGQFAWTTSIPSGPSGATVFRRPYLELDTEWEELGETPLNDIRFPFGMSVVRLELDDRPPLYRIIGGSATRRANSTLPLHDPRPLFSYTRFRPEPFIIDDAESKPNGMVRVPGWKQPFRNPTTEVFDFFIDRYEVTNREFKQFVDAGGYQRQELWTEAFQSDGNLLSWDEAMVLLVDQTERSGPSTWVAGNYPDGEDDHPVSGVSWYEADAYARFVGGELPTYAHWRRAIADGALPWMLPMSNLGNQHSAPVGEFCGIGWTGALDLAGNVREWCYNAIGDQRVILGGGWSDLPYVVYESILDPQSLPPFDRSAINGFRLAQTADNEQVSQLLRSPLPEPVRPSVAEPVSDEVFEIYRRSYDYDIEKQFDEKVEEIEETRYWRRERVSISAPYNDDRIPIYLYFPLEDRSNFQTVVFWPTIGGFFLDTPRNIQNPPFDFILKNGRAVVYPILQGTYERRNPEYPDWMSSAGRDLVYQQIIDFRRTLDYLETRPEFDDEAIALYGVSYGGRIGPMAMAIEPRVQAGVLNQAGINFEVRSEIDVTHYLPRVTKPVLQFNGRFDTDFRYDTSAKPFFDLLGTPATDKKHVVEDTGHFVPVPVYVGETLDWLDKYLGPVEQ